MRKLNDSSTIIILLICALGVYVIKYLLSVFLAHYFGSILYGDFAVAMKILILLATVTLMGSRTSTQRFLSEYIQVEDKKNILSFLRWNRRILTISFSLCLLAAILSIFIMHMLHFFNIKSIHDYHLAVYMLWVAPIVAISFLLTTFLLTNNHPILSYILGISAGYLLLLLFFGTNAIFQLVTLNRIAIAIIIGLVFFTLAILQIFVLRKKIPLFFHELLESFSERTDSFKRIWFSSSARFISSNIIRTITSSADLLILEIVNFSETSVAHYAAIMSIIGIIWLIPKSTYLAVKPQISTLIESENGQKLLQKKLNTANLITLLFFITTSVVIAYFSSTLLLHFGPSYLVAKWPLIILLFGCIFATYTAPPALLLNYSGHEDTILHINLFTFIIMVITGFILAFFWGIYGMAIAVSLAYFIKLIMSLIQVRKHLNIRALSII